MLIRIERFRSPSEMRSFEYPNCVPIDLLFGKGEAFHDLPQIRELSGAVGDHAILAGIIGIGAMILDIPSLEALAFEADEVARHLPRDPVQYQMQQHNSAFLRALRRRDRDR